jgi:hypothetical protein
MVPQVEYANAMLERGSKISINEFNRIMGHANKKILIKTAEYYGIKLSGLFEKC